MEIKKLLNIINDKNIENLKDLFELNLSSESTIRRKLKELEDLGYISLKRGGNISIIDNKEVSIKDEYKMDINKLEKKQIAKYAASLVNDNDIIFIDNGTTIRYMLDYLKDKNITIYTNGYKHLDYIGGLDLRIIPGKVRSKEGAIVGEEAILFLEQLNIDKTFIGANGFSKVEGVTTPNEDEKNLKRFVLKKAKESYVVIDSSKYGINSKYKICDLEDYNIINNQKK